MEFIKKTIYRVMTTGHTTGCTGTCMVIIPNTGITYQLKIGLVQNAHDIGFFDAYIEPENNLIFYTAPITSINKISAISGGDIISDGGNPVLMRGVVWNTSPSPTILNSKTNNGTGIGAFVSQLTNLMSGVTYYVSAYVTNSEGTFYAEEISFKTLASPIVTTKPITAIDKTSAISGGDITSDGGNPILVRGIVWNTSPSPTIFNSKTNNGTGIGIFASNLTGLVTITTYYVRAYATTIIETVYGNELTFITTGIPTVTTAAVTQIKNISATGGGNVTSENGSLVTVKGIVWSLSPNPNIDDDNVVLDGIGFGAFTVPITGLVKITKYYVKAFATNSVGTGYGNQVDFTTISLPTVITNDATDITFNSGLVNGNATNDGGSAIISTGFEWGVIPGALTQTEYVGSGIGAFSSAISPLVGSTTYYFRAFATNFAGTDYGSELNFVTLPTPPPSIHVQEIGPTTQTTSVLRASITNYGTHLVTTRGIAYATTENPTILNYYAPNGSGNTMFFTTIGTNTPASNVPLMPNTLYYVRAYLYTAENDYEYSNQIEITTLEIVVPTLTTKAITNIMSDMATGGGENIVDGGGLVTIKGLKFGKVSGIYTRSENYIGTGSADYIMNITGLDYATTYYVVAFATNSAGTGYGQEVSFTSRPLIPLVTTSSAQNITQSSADGYGYGLNRGAIITSRGFDFCPTAGGTWHSIPALGGGEGEFTATITPLVAETSYTYRACATNSEGTGCGTEESFTTCSLPFTVSTIQAIDTSRTTLTISSNISYSGSYFISDRGVVWNYITNPTISDFHASNGSGTGGYNTTMSPLNPNTLYYIKAYAYTSELGYCYGNEIQEPTDPIVVPTLTAKATSSITSYGATSGGENIDDGGGSVTGKGVKIGTTPGVYPRTIPAIGSGSANYTVNISGLVYATPYYVVAYATNSAGTGFSEAVTFTTRPLIPNVTTQAATSIGIYNAIGNGYGENCGATITSRGFQFCMSGEGTWHSISASGGGEGAFTADLTPLAANTRYYYRACATNSEGIGCGTELYFDTLPVPIPIVTLQYEMSKTQTSAEFRSSVTYSNSADITSRGIAWNTNPNPTTSNYFQPSGSGTGVYDTTMSALSPGTLYYVKAYACSATFGAIYSGNECQVTTNPILAPTLTTMATSSITSYGATSGGENINDGGGLVTVKGVKYGISTGVYPSTCADGSGSANYTVNISGLNNATPYYVVAYATNSAGTSCGQEVTFTTLAVAPSVTTQAATSIGIYDATGNGDITSNGGSAITARGFEFCMSGEGTWHSISASGTGVGAFSASICPLAANSTYYYHACATNGIGTTCGTDVTFATSPAPSPTVMTSTACDVGTNSATVRSSVTYGGSETIGDKGLVWSTISPPTYNDYCCSSGSGGVGTYDINMLSLNSNTTYYYRAYYYSTYFGGYNYSSERCLTTELTTTTTTTSTSTTTTTTTAGPTQMHLVDCTPLDICLGVAQMTPTITGSDCFDLTMGYDLGKVGKAAILVCITCYNGIGTYQLYCCYSVNPSTCCITNTISLTVKPSDIICACVTADDIFTSASSPHACIWLSSISQITGSYSIGSLCYVCRGSAL